MLPLAWLRLALLAAAGFAALAAVLALQWHSIPKQLALPDVHPSVMLVDKPGALLGVANILVCLGLLAAAPALKWELWVVTLVCALLHALYSFIAYVGCKGRWCKVSAAPGLAPETASQRQEVVSSAGCVEAGAAAASGGSEAAEQQQAAAIVELVQQQQQSVVPAASEQGLHQRHHQQHHQQQESEGCRWQASLDAVDGSRTEGLDACLDGVRQQLSRGTSRVQLLSAEQHAACSDASAAVFEHSAATFSGDGFCAAACEEGQGCKATGPAPVPPATAALPGSGPGLRPPPAPTFWHAVVVLPWEVVPFVLGMFCVVEGLNATGWVDSLAAWLAAGLGGSVWGALFGIGGLSLLLANIINNQVGAYQAEQDGCAHACWRCQ